MKCHYFHVYSKHFCGPNQNFSDPEIEGGMVSSNTSEVDFFRSELKGHKFVVLFRSSTRAFFPKIDAREKPVFKNQCEIF